MYKSFAELSAAAERMPKKRRVAIAAAQDAHVIEGAQLIKARGIAQPVLVGDKNKIVEIIRSLDCSIGDFEIVDAERGSEGQTAVELVKCGEASVLMKGLVETRELLSPVVKSENGLRTGRIMSHLVLFDGIKGRETLLATSDGGMVMYPVLDDKIAIIENAVGVLHKLGCERPSIAALAAIEKINPKMKETVEADALKQLCLSGGLSGCVVEGPISYDVAMSAEIAAIKGFDSPYCGRFDMLLMPDMTAGNILGKCLTVTCGAQLAGIVIGAKAPIVLTSRGSTPQEKFYSTALAIVAAEA